VRWLGEEYYNKTFKTKERWVSKKKPQRFYLPWWYLQSAL